MPDPVAQALDLAVDQLLASTGQYLVLAAPLGLGKPHRLINAITRRIAADLGRSLRLLTAPIRSRGNTEDRGVAGGSIAALDQALRGCLDQPHHERLRVEQGACPCQGRSSCCNAETRAAWTREQAACPV